MEIKAKLEDLLSDSHLAEDGFLLKHVQKNKQGYVSLKLLTGSKKVRRGKKKRTNLNHILASTTARCRVLSEVLAFRQFERKQPSEMQTRLRLLLFVSDKGPDHKLARDSGGSGGL